MKITRETKFRQVLVSPYLMPELFSLYDTHGLPFAFSIGMTYRRGLVPDWVSLVRNAKSAGWSSKHLQDTVGEALRELFGPKAPLEQLRALTEVIYGDSRP